MFGRPGLPSFEYVRPESHEAVVRLLEEHGEAARLMMGGTDLFPGLREGRYKPTIVIDVKHLPGMRQIGLGLDGGLVIGAGVTMNQLAGHPWVREQIPVLVVAASSVAGVQVRNRATIGGNLCNASPCADMAPCLLVLEATVTLHSARGRRVLPLARFLTGPGQTALAASELMLSIEVPTPPDGSVGCYQKMGRQRAGDLALVGIAVLGHPDPGSDSGICFRVGLGSVAPVPMRAERAEAILARGDLSDAKLEEASLAAAEAARPISDVRGSAEYQRAMVRALTLRALRQVRGVLTNMDGRSGR